MIRLETVSLIWRPCSRVVANVSHHASSSKRSALLSLSRCRWMARQMRQRTPPLREGRFSHDGYDGISFNGEKRKQTTAHTSAALVLCFYD